MARHPETAFGKSERYMDQETRLYARRGDRRGDNRSGRTALNGCPYSLVRWQFEGDSQVAEMQTVNLECGLKLRARPRPDSRITHSLLEKSAAVMSRRFALGWSAETTSTS